MAWTTPRIWTDGEVVTAALLNAQIRDNLNEVSPDSLAAAFVGRVEGLIGGDSSPATKAANAAILEAATTPNSSAIIPVHPLGTAVPYYTNEVSLVGPVSLKGEDMTVQVRNDSGSVFSVSGTSINVSNLYIRSDGGGHTIRQTGVVDQGHWDKVKLWQGGDGYSIWDNAAFGFIDMRFSNFQSWHTQTATVATWNLVATGGNINNNVWEKFRAQFSGNYHFNMESTDVNCQHANVWRDATWEVCSGGMVRMIGCRDYVIDNSTLWDLLAGTGGHDTLERHGIYADTNGAGALCIGTIRNHKRLDSTVDSGFYDIKLPATAKGPGTVIERCQNISSANPLTLDLNSNDCLVVNPGASASTLTTYANSTLAQFIDKSGVTLPTTQSFSVGTATMAKGFKVDVSADPGSVAANSELDFALTVTGAAAGDAATVSTGSALEAGLGIVGCWATLNTVTIRLRNFTGSAIDPAARNWRVAIHR